MMMIKLVKQEKVSAREIEPYINDLPDYKDLAERIAKYVNTHDYYNLGQIASIIDDFYNYSCGNGIAEDIECLF